MAARLLLALTLVGAVEAQATDEGDLDTVVMLQSQAGLRQENQRRTYQPDESVARFARLDKAARYLDETVGARVMGEVDSVAYSYKDPRGKRDPSLGPLPIVPSDRFLRSTSYRVWNYTEAKILVFPWKVGMLGKHFGIGDGLGNVIHLNLLGDVLYTAIKEVGDPQLSVKDRWYIMPDEAYNHTADGADDEIVKRGLALVGKHLGIKVADYNCEDFATGLRFGEDSHHSGQRDWWVQFIGDTEKKILGTTALTKWAKNSKWLFKTLDDMVGWTNDAGISMKAADIFEQVL